PGGGVLDCRAMSEQDGSRDTGQDETRPSVDAEPETLDVDAAATRLGITADAVRKRIRRRHLRAFKGPDGQWHILASDLDQPRDMARDTRPDGTGPITGQDSASLATEPAEIVAVLRDEIQHLRHLVEARDQEIERLRSTPDPLIAQLRGEVVYLRDELSRAYEALAEERRIIAGLVSRIPQLTSPETTRQDRTGQDVAGDVASPPATSPQPEQPRRRWWQVWR
ncbi:MAG TPA: hypothetical protein VGW38_00205, partial [Chloroflexota bacterium]|nr:hypothetical protein [Chloroflexota bacterium]